MERFGVAREEKVLSVATDSLTTSHPPDRKSAMFLLRDVFQVEAPRAAVQKTWSVLNKKKVLGRALSCRQLLQLYTCLLSLLKMSEKVADAPNRNLTGTRPNIIFRIISSPLSLRPHAAVSLPPASVKRHILTPKSSTEHVANKEQLSLFSWRRKGRGERGWIGMEDGERHPLPIILSEHRKSSEATFAPLIINIRNSDC